MSWTEYYCRFTNALNYVDPLGSRRKCIERIFNNEVELRAYFYHKRSPDVSSETNWNRSVVVVTILKSIARGGESLFMVAPEGTCSCGKWSEFSYIGNNICEECMILMYIKLHNYHVISPYCC